MPSIGAFVAERARGVPGIRVVAPHRYDGSLFLRYLRLTWDALTVRGTFDGVEAHVLFPAGAIALLAAWLRRVPLVVYVHGDEVREVAYRNRIYTRISRFVASHAAELVTNSEDTAAYTERLGRRPVIIPPGVDLSVFRPSPRPAVSRVLYVGGNRPEKGYTVARELADTLIGPYLDERPLSEMPSLMAAHDVLLMPSLEEGFGVAAVEAIAAGRWVVATAVGGLVEVISDGVNGTLVRNGDFRAAIDAVPDYDPFALAATAGRFALEHEQRRLDELWESTISTLDRR